MSKNINSMFFICFRFVCLFVFSKTHIFISPLAADARHKQMLFTLVLYETRSNVAVRQSHFQHKRPSGNSLHFW